MLRVLLAGLPLTLAAALPAHAAPEQRLTPTEIGRLKSGGNLGASGVAGIETTVVSGDPSGPGLYTIRLSVPANTEIQAHAHRDERSGVVVSGIWYFGYGPQANRTGLKTLPPGSFYTEPAGAAHFARTGAEPVVVYVTGYGPTDTTYVEAAKDPRRP